MSDTTLDNAVKLAGEGFIAPGASLLLDGNFKAGSLHVVAGFAARALLGPVGWFLVAASSFAKSTTGKNLVEQFESAKKETPAAHTAKA
jgi:hypothetical protein